jgi:hypothetical protein
VRVAALLLAAEAALMYSVYNPQDLGTTIAVGAWTLIAIYVIVVLVHYAEGARRHREQLSVRLRDEMRESLDGAVDALVGALHVREQDATAARDAVRLIRSRYDTTEPGRREGDPT